MRHTVPSVLNTTIDYFSDLFIAALAINVGAKGIYALLLLIRQRN